MIAVRIFLIVILFALGFEAFGTFIEAKRPPIEVKAREIVEQPYQIDDGLDGEDLLIDVVPARRRRGVGWQPLKRSDGSLHIMATNPTNLRQQMLDIIEDHMLNDLKVARRYNIEPEEILEDLRRKQE